MENGRVTGKVKWFSKSYGFIGREGGPDVFVHESAIEMNGYRTLQKDQLVSFEIVQGDKGLQANGVRVVSEERAEG